MGNRVEEGQTHKYLGDGYFNLEDYKQEIQYFELSLSIAKEMGKRDEEEVLYADLGFSYKNLKDYKQVIQYFELALSILEEIGDKDQERLTNKELTGECYSTSRTTNKQYILLSYA